MLLADLAIRAAYQNYEQAFRLHMQAKMGQQR
jgi:hypothetical protein